MTLEEHIYRILLTQGPCLLSDLYCVEEDPMKILDAVDNLMSAGIADWVDDPLGQKGMVYVGLKQ